jgi:hypothetical protein
VVEAPCYKPEGRGFYSFFLSASMNVILIVTLRLNLSTSIRNGYFLVKFSRLFPVHLLSIALT